MSKPKLIPNAEKKAEMKGLMKKAINCHLQSIRNQANILSRVIDQAEEVMTEGECFRSNEYSAVAMMVCRMERLVERVTEIMNKAK